MTPCTPYTPSTPVPYGLHQMTSGTSIEEHSSCMVAQQGYESMMYECMLLECHGA